MARKVRAEWTPPKSAQRVREKLDAASSARKAGESGVEHWQRTVSEISYQNTIIHAGNLVHWYYYHTRNSTGSVEGFPDLVGVSVQRKRTIFVEVKNETYDPEPKQIAYLDRLAAAGNEAYLTRPGWWDDIVLIHNAPERPIGLLSEWGGKYIGRRWRTKAGGPWGVAVNARRGKLGIELRLIDEQSGKAPHWHPLSDIERSEELPWL